MVGALAGLLGGGAESRMQTQGGIVKRARGWFWRTRFYRENDEERYFRMGNGELRRKDLELWRKAQRGNGAPDTRREWRRWQRRAGGKMTVEARRMWQLRRVLSRKGVL